MNLRPAVYFDADSGPVLVASQDTTGQKAYDSTSQWFHVKNISKFRDACRRLPAI
jgi:hypothetical protein